MGLLLGGMTALSAAGQTIVITSFQRGGIIVWSNSVPTMYYNVQWAGALSGAPAWQTNYTSLMDIQSAYSFVTAKVPVYYRITATSNATAPSGAGAAVPKTGQTNSYRAGDDGDLEKGYTWPSPRFSPGASGDATNTVTDNLTGLVWARNASLGGLMNWGAAVDYCTNLEYGGYSDWRLPNRHELFSLLDDGKNNPSLPDGHPFSGVQSSWYWTSTTDAGNTDRGWCIGLGTGILWYYDKDPNNFYVWPVRGGL